MSGSGKSLSTAGSGVDLSFHVLALGALPLYLHAYCYASCAAKHHHSVMTWHLNASLDGCSLLQEQQRGLKHPQAKDFLNYVKWRQTVHFKKLENPKVCASSLNFNALQQHDWQAETAHSVILMQQHHLLST